MSKHCGWLIGAMLALPGVLMAQAPAAGQDAVPAPAADAVPPPEIPFGAMDAATLQMPESLDIDNFGGGPIRGGIETGVVYEGPGVRIRGDNGLEIFANRLVWDIKARTATCEGDVSVYQGNILQRGERVVYHYETKRLDTTGLRVSLDPVLLESGKFRLEEQDGRQVYVGEDAGITTDDAEDPNYWIRAKEIRVVPGDRVVFRGMRVYAGDTPVFWLPYLAQPLHAELGYHFIPGARSNWGPFLLNRYGIMLGGETDPVTGLQQNAWLLSRWHLDLRASRGAGVGVDLVDTRLGGSKDISGLSLYYLNDLDPGESRSGLPRGFVNEDRYRVGFQHRVDGVGLPGGGWRADANLTWLSDSHYLEDFETARYRTDPEPDNTLGLYRRGETSLFSAFTRWRVNDFHRSDTRLPELAFDQSRRPLFGSPVLHEGRTSLAVLGENPASHTRNGLLRPLTGMSAGDPAARRLLDQLRGHERRLAERMVALPLGDPGREAVRTQLLDAGFTRFDTYHQFSAPMELGGLVSFTPQAGAGYSNYFATEGPGGNLDRTHAHLGAEAAVKFSKDLGALRDHGLGIDGLLHVCQPYTRWSLVSTDDYEPGDPAVDRLTPTTRPRPIDPARFTAVDELQSWNILRVGARNRLLTRRDGGSLEWMFLDTYIDAFMEDPEGTRDFSSLHNDLRWQPVPWVGVDLETQLPVVAGGDEFNQFNTLLRFLPSKAFEFSLGYNRLSGHPELTDSNRFDFRTYFRINGDWGFGTRNILEMDDGTFEYQQLTLHRDMGNWVGGIGLSMHDNRIEEEYGMVFSLTLKDFPSVSLPFEMDAP